MSTICVLLALTAANNLFLHQLDVKNVFLHGDLHEEVYMLPSKGYSIPPGKIIKLNKSLYGLKQASKQSYAKLSSALLECGFTTATANHSLFLKRCGSSFLALLVYVDDIITVNIINSWFSASKLIYIKDSRLRILES